MNGSDPDHLDLADLILSYYAPQIQDLCASVADERVCMLLGPRFTGKTAILREVEKRLAGDEAYLTVFIDLYRVDTATHYTFFRDLSRCFSEALAPGGLAPLGGLDNLPFISDAHSGSTFGAFLEWATEFLGRGIVLIVDHLEATPTDLFQELLASLRKVYMNQVTAACRVAIIVGGALSVAPKTVGPRSPFHNIARRVFVEGFDYQATWKLINSMLASAGVTPTDKALSLLIRETCGAPILARQITERCLKTTAASGTRGLKEVAVRRVITQFCRREVDDYKPLDEAYSLIEYDPDLLECITLLLEQGRVPKRDLPLPLTADLDPLLLTGVVRRDEGAVYSIQNGIYERFLRERFTPARVGRLMMTSGRWDKAIHSLEKSLRQGDLQSRADLLATTVSAMFAAEDMHHAAYFLNRGLVIGFGIQEAKLWYFEPDRQVLKLAGQIGVPRPEESLVAPELSLDADRPEVRAFRQARFLRRQSGESSQLILPLMSHGEEAQGILTIDQIAAGSSAPHELQERLGAYLGQATRAFVEITKRHQQRIVYDRQDTQQKERAQQLSHLHRISTLCQREQNLDKAFALVLRGITDSEGLGFNRAWLFLLQSNKEVLKGCVGIGHYTKEEAYRDWARIVPFEEFVAHLQEEAPEATPITDRTREMRIRVSVDSWDLFSRALYEFQTLYWSSSNDAPSDLPREFHEAFDPESVYISPLIAQGAALGLIVTDDRFSPRIRSHSDRDVLAAFASQAAAAVLSDRERGKSRQQLELAETMGSIAAVLSKSLDQDTVFARILGEMDQLLPFDSTSIQLVNPEHTALKIVSAHGFTDNDAVLRLSPFSLKDHVPNALVFLVGASRRYDEVALEFPHFSSPEYYVDEINSWMGAPLIVDQQTLGVITLDSKEKGLYTREHETLLNAFASHAAAALYNTRLYEAEKQRAEELDILANVLNALRAEVTANPRKLLQTIVVGACSVTKADCAVIYPFVPGTNTYDSANIAAYGLLLEQEFAPSDKTRDEGRSLGHSVVKQGIRIARDVANDEDVGLERHPFIEREKIRAFVGVSLIADGVPLGILFVNYRQPRHFTNEDLKTIHRLAGPAAVALQDAYLFQQTSDQLEKQLSELTRLAEIDDAISTLDLQKVLNIVLDAALELTDAPVGTVQILSEKGDELILMASQGASLASIGERLPIIEGITGMVARTGKFRSVGNVHASNWRDVYRAYIPNMVSELAVPIKYNEQVLGVINIESSQADAFSEANVKTILNLSRQAGIAIHNAQQYNELVRERSNSEAAGALAWMSVFGANWSHDATQVTFSMRNNIYNLRNLAGMPPDAGKFLDRLDDSVREIRSIKPEFPIPADPNKLEMVKIEPLLEEWVNEWVKSWRERKGAKVELLLDLNCPDVSVRVQEPVFEMALQKLVDNALRHMPSDSGILKVTAHQQDHDYQILIEDNGDGIPEPFRPLYGKVALDPPRGSGRGALLAGFILRKYRGDLNLVWSHTNEGTCIELLLPIA
jgi:GAF domain-containing protein